MKFSLYEPAEFSTCMCFCVDGKSKMVNITDHIHHSTMLDNVYIKKEILLCKAKTYFASKLYMNGTGNLMVLYVFIFHVD